MCVLMCMCVEGWEADQRYNHSKILGSGRETDPGVFAGAGAGALGQREPRDASKNGTHAHTKCSLPGKQQSTGWKNMVTDALKLTTLRACRGREQLKGRRTTGTEYNVMGERSLEGL